MTTDAREYNLTNLVIRTEQAYDLLSDEMARAALRAETDKVVEKVHLARGLLEDAISDIERQGDRPAIEVKTDIVVAWSILDQLLK